MNAGIAEEFVNFPSGDLNLSGILSYPDEGKPRLAILLCSPHPHFAGNMDNNVIQELAQTLSQHSLVLRFDYRGVGKSEIQLPVELSVYDYWNEVEEKKDYTDALADVAAAHAFLRQAACGLPISIIGYSFGSIVGSLYGYKRDDIRTLAAIAFPFTRMDSSFLQESLNPVLILSGSDDFVFTPEAADQLRKSQNQNLIVRILQNQDHFFRGATEFLLMHLNPFLYINRAFIHESNR